MELFGKIVTLFSLALANSKIGGVMSSIISVFKDFNFLTLLSVMILALFLDDVKTTCSSSPEEVGFVDKVDDILDVISAIDFPVLKLIGLMELVAKRIIQKKKKKKEEISKSIKKKSYILDNINSYLFCLISKVYCLR